MSLSAVSPAPPPPENAPRSAEFEADLARLTEVMTTWPQTYLVGRSTRTILRLPPGQPMTTTQRVLGGGVAIVLRFLVPGIATTATGSWAGAPVWTWLGITVFPALFEVFWGGAMDRSFFRQLNALPATLEREADLRELIDFTNRRWRARFYVPVAIAIALLVLAAVALVAPVDLRALHPGSLALIALVLYEFGEERSMRSLYFGLYGHESRYPHRLSWLSPADSPVIQDLLRLWSRLAFVSGLGLAVDFVFVVILVAPDSLQALFAPVAGFALAALVLDTASLLNLRRSVQRVVRHTRDATLDRLRRRIDDFEPRLEDLTPGESDQLRDLIATYAAVRDAPTGPSGAQTFGHALTALAIPALAFFLAVMAEVYAERLLGQLLP